MKKIVLIIAFVVGGFCARSQSFEIEQLILDWQKLSALKSILSDLYKGYQILSEGYNAVRDVSEGNFSLHKAFLDGLLLVSPAVRNYPRVTDIIDYQSRLVSEYKAAFRRFSSDKNFTPDEIIYIGEVYANLFSESLQDISNLTTVLTAGSLRMNDDERLLAIDGIYSSSKNKLLFLHEFDVGTVMISMRRASQRNDNQSMQNLYGLK
ncbi:MAG: hypothetical protein C5B59_09995 [Bacteroidetes bacterium]|nr:MAG: hypothetical protein C5B59_09995 [Bacteroidota bacterium]